MVSKTGPIRAIPLDRNIYDLSPEEAGKIRQVPGSLEAALAALESDNAFLRKGDVFTDDVVQTWIEYKRKREIDTIKLRPHPGVLPVFRYLKTLKARRLKPAMHQGAIAQSMTRAQGLRLRQPAGKP